MTSNETVVKEVLQFDVAAYVAAARANGRGQLDPSMRQHMAQLYEDLRPVLADRTLPIGRAELRDLRLAELVLQNEWKLARSPGTESLCPMHADLPPESPGRRNLSYANMRLLNETVGARRHTSDAVVEAQCWDAARYLTGSWLAWEQTLSAGTATWCVDDPPGSDELEERIVRLRALSDGLPGDGRPALSAAATAPGAWSGYAGRAGRANMLEYLLCLPFGQRHEEGAFLRTIHLTEVATWGMLARVMSAVEWIKEGRPGPAADCLDRAAGFADWQLRVLSILRRTMAVERFGSFRSDTGDSSAVQSLGSQLLDIHLFGVHPAKVAALSQVPENGFLLRYANADFAPLWKALHQATAIPSAPGEHLLDAARQLDDLLFRWRRMHIGMAYRYLPKAANGTGGTDGAAYLEAFYRRRMFGTDGRLLGYHGLAGAGDTSSFARPPFSPDS